MLIETIREHKHRAFWQFDECGKTVRLVLSQRQIEAEHCVPHKRHVAKRAFCLSSDDMHHFELLANARLITFDEAAFIDYPRPESAVAVDCVAAIRFNKMHSLVERCHNFLHDERSEVFNRPYVDQGYVYDLLTTYGLVPCVCMDTMQGNALVVSLRALGHYPAYSPLLVKKYMLQESFWFNGHLLH